MRQLLSIMILMFCTAAVQGQNFSLIDDTPASSSSSVQIEPQAVIVGPLKVNVRQVSIIVTEFAEVRDVEGGKKAVFLGTDGLLAYNGVLVKVDSPINNPLLRIYKRPDLFPPATMRKYSDNEWFYYGSPGKYVIEFLDYGDNGWNSEFIEVEIKDGGLGDGDDGDDDDGDDDDGDDDDGDDGDDGDAGDYEEIRTTTATMVRELNDKDVANSLIREYTTALSNLTGTVAEMRIQIRDARRAAFQNVPSRNANWNNLLLKIDQMMIDAGVDTPEEYKKAVEAYVNGIGDGIR